MSEKEHFITRVCMCACLCTDIILLIYYLCCRSLLETSLYAFL